MQVSLAGIATLDYESKKGNSKTNAFLALSHCTEVPAGAHLARLLYSATTRDVLAWACALRVKNKLEYNRG